MVHISATQKTNIDLLLELLLYEADNYNIQSSMDRNAICIALESKHSGSKTCSVVVREGTLKLGDVLVGKNTYCKVKNMTDDKENSMEECKAGFAVEVVRFSSKITHKKDRIQRPSGRWRNIKSSQRGKISQKMHRAAKVLG